MRIELLRILAISSVGLAAYPALAETYTAKVYSAPGTYEQMYVFGAGDNGLMSGYASGLFPGAEKAFYRTNSGSVNMNPGIWQSSFIMDSWGSTYHCGYGKEFGSQNRALFWVGGGSAVDLHPLTGGYTASHAFGGGGQLQVGAVNGNIACEQCGITVEGHAGVWNRTPGSFKRLHSLTHSETQAYGTDGTKIVGIGFHRVDSSRNALIWNSVNSMSTNIRPSGSTESVATSVWGNQQGGYYRSVATGNEYHACIWAGTAASALDINPNAVFKTSIVQAVRNGLQVGYAHPLGNPNRQQAIAWHGTAASWINLHSKLPAMFHTWNSHAEGIDNLGNVVGYVEKPDKTDVRPVIWLRS